jgi:hypothetical protein
VVEIKSRTPIHYVWVVISKSCTPIQCGSELAREAVDLAVVLAVDLDLPALFP